MSFTKEKREKIKRYILDKIDDENNDFVSKTVQTFGISFNTVYRYLRDLEKNNVIEKGKDGYKLVETDYFILLRRSHAELSEEDIIYKNYVQKHIENMPDNAQRIWQYAFTEMMNNAIDHSEAENVTIFIIQDYMSTTVLIDDDGIGIFRKIKEYYNYETLDDAVNELFKGKLTTDSQNHSGEGIFFTSRILDQFAAMSDGKIFSHDKFSGNLRNLEDIEVLRQWRDRKGTIIYMKLSNFTNKVLKEVFDMFADIDGGFIKTHVPIKNVYETYPVSRSQAKRLCHRFENFQEIELDFDGIEEIGQGFAHELFVVFQSNHPDVKLIPLNASKDVERMINHVMQTKV